MTDPEQTIATIDEADVAKRIEALAERSAALTERINAAGGDNVEVLAVTKGHPVEAAVAAARYGLRVLGENYAQEMQAKAPVVAVEDEVKWHFIGQLQTNKVRLINDVVSVWQSVDRLKVGREIAKRSPGATVFAQVNLSEEPQKAGCNFEDLDELVDGLLAADLVVDGLMGVGSAADDVATAKGFARLRTTVDRLGLAQCSMGMSADLELAIREGSTMVRVGSDLFGPRP